MRFNTALFALLVVPQAFAASTINPLARLYTVTHSGYLDNFYSLSESQIAEAMAVGYVNKQVVGFVETVADPSPPTHPALPFHRTFGGAPQYDHFYTTRAGDYDFVIDYGYSDEGTEGALRLAPWGTGSVPLYRVSNFTPSTGDVMHWYGIDLGQRNAYIAAGWANEGIEGYMWPVPTPNVNMQGGGASVSIYKYPTTSPVLTTPSYREPGESVFFGSCGGSTNLYVDGTFYGTHYTTYGLLPGTAGTYGCYATLFGAPPGTHTYRAEFTGYVARYSDATRVSTTIRAPYTMQGSLTN